MLRYFVKNKLLDEDLKNSDKIVSMYTIKTLILWQCERMPIQWFTQNNSYEICCYLLRILLNWLLKMECRNYFIVKCNLFAFDMNENYYKLMVQTLSNYTNMKHLTQWFEENYTQRCNLYQILQEEKGSYEVNHSTLVGSKHHLYKFALAENYLSCMVSRMKWSYYYTNSTSPLPSNSYLGMCAKHIGVIDDFFVEFYMGHVILQAVTFEKTHKKHDIVLAMLSSLFVSQEFTTEVSPFSCHSSVFHLIVRKYYYKIAKAVLRDRVSCIPDDQILKMKLATIFMKKALSQTHGDPRRLHMIRVHLAALYFCRQRYGKCSEYIDKVAKRTSDCELAFDPRNLYFIDEVIIAVGLSYLVNHNSVQLQGGRIDRSFSISVYFFRNWLCCLCRMMPNDVIICNTSKSCIPKNTIDILLLLILKRKMKK